MSRSTQKENRRWLDPNREGRGGRRSGRYCARCGTTVQSARILKGLNLCEFCVRELEKARDGRWSCLGCGKIAPDQLRKYGGYCKDCVCPACGRPDPEAVHKYGMCRQCMTQVGEFCRRCGKEAAAQVRKNRGLCDACAKEVQSGR
ncbi:MAG: hypothetical protein M1379_10635 [Firmicutes bacterium]|nr:hypothetical protein [Bacillota bacterium]